MLIIKSQFCNAVYLMDYLSVYFSAKVSSKDFDFWMKNDRVVIGRHSSTRGEVDINMGHSSFISRKHIEIFHEDGNFFLICNGKNGVFVDGAFQCTGGAPLQLAKS